MRVLLLPVKNPRFAKQRLSTHLTPDQREALMWSMLEDVTRAVSSARRVQRAVVLTSCPSVARFARSHDLEVHLEKEQHSESRSVDLLCRELSRQGVDSVLRLPADLPLLQPADVDELLSWEAPGPAALLVPSREGTGTNALLRCPPDAFPSRFGPHSLQKHLQEARRRGVCVQLLQNPRVALDIDHWQDLLDFSLLAAKTRTGSLVKEVLEAVGRPGHES